jgi:8-amino-7-oxononanoate synthase
METTMSASQALSDSTVDAKRLLAKGLAARLHQGNTGAPPGAAAVPVPGNTNRTASIANLPAEVYDVSLFPERKVMENMMGYLQGLGVKNHYFCRHTDVSRELMTVEGRECINYSGYNYLGIGGNQRVADAVKSAVDQYGASASASRIVAGNTDLHETLEAEMAEFLGTEACVVSVGGYQTNVTTIGYLCDRNDLILHDELVHNSIMTGCVLSGARRVPFPHNDYAALESLLRENRLNHRRVLIVTEGVYSMDGDIPDIARLVRLKKEYKALLMVDEAHSLGVIGATGRGVIEHFDLAPGDIDILMGTLSKTFASCGGFIAGRRELIDILKYFAPGLVLYSAGISPVSTAAALAALRVLRQEPARVEKLRENARFFVERARAAGLDTGLSRGSAVVPVMLHDDDLALRVVDRLMEQDGICVHAMLYPSVPKGAARLRFFLSAAHTHEQLAYTVDRLAARIAGREVREAVLTSRLPRVGG